MTKKENFVAAMAVLSGSYGREITPAGIEGYWIALQDLSEEQLRVGLFRALRNWKSKFMPTAPELRELALGVPDPDQLKLNAELSWEIVRKAMDQYDYVQTVDFGDLVNAVVRALGDWEGLCDKSKKELIFVKKEFEELYLRMLNTDIPPSRGAPLVGRYFKNSIIFDMPGEAVANKRRPGLPAQNTWGTELIRDIADKKSVA